MILQHKSIKILDAVGRKGGFILFKQGKRTVILFMKGIISHSAFINCQWNHITMI